MVIYYYIQFNKYLYCAQLRRIFILLESLCFVVAADMFSSAASVVKPTAVQGAGLKQYIPPCTLSF